jgi:flagellar FliL protein
VVKEIENTGDEPKKKSSKLKWILLVVILLAIGGGGFFAYTQFFKKAPDGQEQTPPTEDAHGEKKDAKKDDKKKSEKPVDVKPVSLPTFLVNLADPLGRRYIKLTIDVEMEDELAAKDLEKNLAKVRDTIILLLSSKTYADLSTLESKQLLKMEIVNQLNLILNTKKVKNVYFTDLVIQ